MFHLSRVTSENQTLGYWRMFAQRLTLVNFCQKFYPRITPAVG